MSRADRSYKDLKQKQKSAIAPRTEYEEFCKIVDKREAGYKERILRDIQNGITLEKLNMKKHKKTPEEKAAVLIMKRKQRRAKKHAMKNHVVENNTSQDDTFFYIAGYTSGGHHKE